MENLALRFRWTGRAPIPGAAILLWACGGSESSTTGEVNPGADVPLVEEVGFGTDASPREEVGPVADTPPTEEDTPPRTDLETADPGPADEGSDPGTGPTGVWQDPDTGLFWQNTPDLWQGNWQGAMAWCDQLVLGGFDDWRLPGLNDLRSLVRGCPATMTGGTCKATDTCRGEPPQENCLNHDCAVPPCDLGAGPANGCYRPEPLVGSCEYHWTAIESSTYSDSAWYVDFLSGVVSPIEKAWKDLFARCVRGP